MRKSIYEYSDYNGGEHFNTQVVVIGTGCGGASVAKKLSDQGIDVILLEQGGYYPSSKMDQNELNMAGKLYGERSFATSHDAGNVLAYGNNVGGASVHYWADSYRTPPEKIQRWRDHFQIEGHDTEDLNPAFEEIEAELNIHQADDSLFNTMNSKLRSATEALNWHAHRVPQARKNCLKSGHCMQGCRYDAKQSQLVTHIPKALKNGAKLFADARAGKLIHSKGKVTGLEVGIMDRASNKLSGKYFTISATSIVVAAGGFNSSFYLMQQTFASTLPALGKYFSMNPSTIVHAMFDEDITQWRNIPAAWGVDEYRIRTHQIQATKDQNADNYTEGGYLLMPNQLHPAALAATIPGIGKDHREWMKNLKQVGGTIAWMDDIEEELGEIRVKDDGHREVFYEYGPLTKKVLKDGIKKQVLVNFQAGAKKVLVAGIQAITFESADQIDKLEELKFEAGGLFMASPHPGGGCRMGRSIESSVVDSKHRVHGFENLFVADSSVFPTSSSLDPSLTIMAFSYIAANHIAQYINSSEVDA